MIKHINKLLTGFVLLMLPMIAFAADVPTDTPDWALKLFSFAAMAVGVVSQVDAQISEEFKRKWPWWLRVVWDFIAGNYKHSKNVDSE